MTSSKKQPVGQEFGVFSRGEGADTQTVTAYTVEDAVRYRFDGWQEVAPAAPENQPEQTDTK